MAEKVGDVYVTVHADNSRLHNELRAQAAKDGKAYANEFDKSLGQEFDRIAAKNRQKLAKAFASGDFSEFEKEMGSVEGAVRKVNDEVDHLISKNDITLKQARQVKEAVAKWAVPKNVVQDTAKVRTSIENAHAEALRMNQAFDRAGRLGSTAMKDIQREAIKMNKEFDRIGKAALDGARGAKKGFSDLHRTLSVIDPLVSGLASGIGSLFGKGSRNNFFNIVGSIMQGMVELFTAPLKLIGPASKAIGMMSDGLDEVGKSAGEAERDVSKLGTAFGEMIAENLNPAGLAVLGGVAAVIVATIGVAAASVFAAMNLAAGAVSLLAGMLLTLASAAAFALAGGLLPLIPAALALAPALFVVVAGISELGKVGTKTFDKTHKDLVRAKDDFTKLKDVAARDFVRVLETVAPTLLKIFAPMIKGASDAMVFIAKDFAAIMNTPGMKAFLAAFQKSMPGILRTLGLAVNRLLTGFIAFFKPILPFAQRLADAFLLISQRFTDWAQSKAGQKAITDFMTKAWDAASSLWSIIVNLTTAIGELFGSGQKNGQGFLDWLDKLTKRFADWLASPQGQTQMKQWFDDAKSAAQGLFDLISSLWTLFDGLDTSGSRASVTALMDVITQLVTLFANAVVAAGNMAQAFFPIFRIIVNIALTAFGAIVQAAVVAFGWIPGGVGDAVRRAGTQFSVFVARTNADLDEIQKTIPLTVDAAQAIAAIGQVKADMNGLTDKTVVVTAETRYVVKGTSPGGGTVTAGGSTRNAAGGIHTNPTNVLLGEAGREAVVPLDRPLALVDPAVRALSAIAQGKTAMGSGGVVGGGKTVNVSPGAIVVNTTQANPRGVALSVLDRLTAAAV